MWVAVTGSHHDGTFSIYHSVDLAQYTLAGYVFPTGHSGAPTWAYGPDFWAPEIHAVPVAGTASAGACECAEEAHILLYLTWMGLQATNIQCTTLPGTLPTNS